MAAGSVPNCEFLRLKNVDSSFQSRSSSIFDRLNTLEPSNENSCSSTENETAMKEQRNLNKDRKNSTNSNSGSRRFPSRVPQHVLSPEKWTKYSLEDDGSKEFRGLNEHSLNKHTAHSFLAALKRRNNIEEGSKANSETLKDSKLLFKKPEQKTDDPPSFSGVWKDGSYVMPEYVVGAARLKGGRKADKHSGVKPVAGNAPVNLGHLDDEFGENVEEGKVENVKGKRNFRKRKLNEERGDDEKA